MAGSRAATWGSLFHAYLLTENLAAADDALAHARELVDECPFEIGRDMIAMSETRFPKARREKNKSRPSSINSSGMRNSG